VRKQYISAVKGEFEKVAEKQIEFNKQNIEFQSTKKGGQLELRIGFKYDYDAYRFLSKMRYFRVPLLSEMGESRGARLIINDTFNLIVKSKEGEFSKDASKEGSSSSSVRKKSQPEAKKKHRQKDSYSRSRSKDKLGKKHYMSHSSSSDSHSDKKDSRFSKFQKTVEPTQEVPKKISKFDQAPQELPKVMPA